MTNEPRKATDVLLELESKLDTLLNLVRAQDLNNKIISNKLNDITQALSKQAVPQSKITVESVNNLPAGSRHPIENFQVIDSERQVLINAESKLPETNSPKGFRRTARPETFAGDDAYLNQAKNNSQPKFPIQMPKGPPPGREIAEAIMPTPPAVKTETVPRSQVPINKSTAPLVQNAIPVIQRVVDKNGKSIFLADVEVVDLSTSQSIFKTRTGGAGKWQASLSVGAYRVTIRKGESVTKSKLEAIQDIQIDGSQSPMELPTLIIK